MRLVSWASDTMVTRQHLLAENSSLRADALLLKAKLQRLVILQQENEDLRKLLNSSTQLGGKTVVAQLLAIDLDPLMQQMIIDKGNKAEVYEGQPVLDAYGVMGQIVTVGHYTSRVLLISDTRSAIPIQDSRSGTRAIAMGLGSNQLLSLIHVPETADIRQGDLLVSSGLGQRFPAGYPVGTVTKVSRAAGDAFMSITVSPSARLDKTEQVLLIWPEKSSNDEELQRQLKQQQLGGSLATTEKES